MMYVRIVVAIAFTAIQIACTSDLVGKRQCDLTDLYKAHFEGEWDDAPPQMIDCECNIDPELRSIEHRDPAKEARDALAAGDRRLLAVSEYSILVPGSSSQWTATDPKIHVIPGTSDRFACYEQLRLQIIARDYAEAYNTVILKALRSEE